MQRATTNAQALALLRGGDRQRVPAHLTAELERLSLLVPELPLNSPRTLQSYALAFVERYQHDILQLEHEREFLCAALTQAWQQTTYAAVIRLVSSLTHVVGRLNNLAQAEHILHIGIKACRSTHDKQHLALFMNRLGNLLYSHGKYRQGWRIWHASLQLDGTSDTLPGIWEPFASFAHITDIVGNYEAAHSFVEICRKGNSNSLAVATFSRGFYARMRNAPDKAHEDFSCCLRLLTRQASDAPPSPYQQLFMLAIQAELARVEGQYQRSQEHAETALSLARLYSDHYTFATLLIDQGLFTHWQGQFADTHATFLRLQDISRQTEAPHISNCCYKLEQFLARTAPQSSNLPLTSQYTPIRTHSPLAYNEPLSEREKEVLQLVATGLSNQQIASHLVVTPATVKKHLEHIYAKLAAHSRTSAIAQARLLQIIS